MKKKPLNPVNPLSVTSKNSVTKDTKVIQNISLSKVLPPKAHDRKSYSKEKISELAQNIEATGMLLQPIIVRKLQGGRYERIVGFRRIEAAKLLNWTKIPAVVLEDINDEQAVLVMLSENMQREDPNIFDQTKGIMEYISISFGKTFAEIKKDLWHFRNVDSKRIKKEDGTYRDEMEAITQKLGKITVSTLINRLSMFTYPDEILDALKEGKITLSVAKVLNSIKEESLLHYRLSEYILGNLSLKEIKGLIAKDKTEESAELSQPKTVSFKIDNSTISFDEPLTEKRIILIEKFLKTI